MPRRELTEQRVEYPEKLFYLGQTVKCRVLSCSSDDEKLILSLRVSPLLVCSILAEVAFLLGIIHFFLENLTYYYV